MKAIKRKYPSVFVPALCALLALSCGQADKNRPPAGGKPIEPSPAEQPGETAQPRKAYLLDVPAKERIAVLFGYGYNDADFVSAALEYFDAAFVSASGEPVIAPLVFPDDFKIGGIPRVSLLYDKLNSFNLAGAVLFGSPENTHLALAKLVDAQGGFPIVSIFSQDDQIGTEALSDLVIDFETEDATGEDGLPPAEFAEEDTGRPIEELCDFAARAVYYVSLLDSPLPKNADLRVHASNMFAGRKIVPFIDAETGMHPVNHFVTQKTPAQP
jgi:hypothetical protein